MQIFECLKLERMRTVVIAHHVFIICVIRQLSSFDRCEFIIIRKLLPFAGITRTRNQNNKRQGKIDVAAAAAFRQSVQF